ncbi:hypothetical protein DINM_006784 [Dirofilaria immitis]|nr:hypothetical protein [Dirofilaria immitis]
MKYFVSLQVGYELIVEVVRLTPNLAPQVSTAMFLKYNTQLGPPFHVIIDTNFVNFSIKYRIDLMQGFMDCLYAKTIPYVTDCVLGELENLDNDAKLLSKLLRIIGLSVCHAVIKEFMPMTASYKELRSKSNGSKWNYAFFEFMQNHVHHAVMHKCYIVATCDKDLKRRIRKIPGVPILYIRQHRFSIERMPDAYGAPVN